MILLYRITPACAGTTVVEYGVNDTVKDHPRVCGDYSLPPHFLHLTLGSPPRVRGLRQCQL